ncbi:hypothetical protein ANOM_008571 [Aspergillus nomiae NRRL 13137]|uniref:Uncharacterized protein n=1 Tax=Aspergillus nomiae NRRL (strain ATCC 15546 / NRRL 13137 / CBS 260.88 / M93) TaxID=1509407 RepID=A0A0L1ITF9_ASPN3|nr:uncharacterized protein ANOM_008571 [Aspergillus nomiae NRRL 13137]KNG82685.1 hypothetical protein ANOM_008571 [Aspergillus nomiae NRRL 13137]
MPRNIPIPAPLQKALVECFRAIARLVRPELQREVVLVGGAASVAHNSVYYTEDVDIAAPENVLLDIWVGVTAGTPEFTMVPDGTVCFNARQGFPVQIDLIQIGDSPMDRIYNAEPFYEGSVASVSDLLRLRAMSYVDCGKSGDDVDFKWLLWEVASGGQILPELDNEERAYVAEAGNSLLGRADRLGLLAVLSEKDATVVFNTMET